MDWNTLANMELNSIGAVLSASATEERIGEGLVDISLLINDKIAFRMMFLWSAWKGGVSRLGAGITRVGTQNIPHYYSVMMQLAEPLLQWLDEEIARRVQCN